MLPRARLVVVGDSPLAAALTGLAPRVGLPVTVVAHGADATRFPDAEKVLASDEPAAVSAGIAAGAFVVVATQGRRDVQGLRAALALQARAIFFVASARKAAVLKAALVEAGQDAAAVAAIVAPAGQALGAQTPEEIALSVLVAVVAARRGAIPPVAPEEPVAAVGSVSSVSSAPAVASALPEPVAAAAASCCGSAPAPVAVVPVADLPAAKASCCGG
jgi:xanthine dehydrogenase accessory factor